jgi:glutamate synthase (NADPH/NADH) small chain
MGKDSGFLEIKRKTADKLDVAERLADYREMYKEMAEDELRNQASRCMECGVPFCHSFGCPLGNVIPEWNDLAYRGRWREAVELLHSTNNFPEITGRICPAMCESACTLSINDEPVAIRQNELVIIERAFREDRIVPLPPTTETGKSVAVVGSGPAGMAAAQQLQRVGHAVTLFEKDELPGGLLRFGIPDFKLDKRVIERRFKQIVAEGVIVQTKVEIGRDISADYLRRQFDAVCLCLGAGVPRDLPIPGRDANGIHFAMPYLIQQNRRLAGLPVAGEEITAKGKRVVIIGGGDTGSDCLGTALRQGAKSVQQLEILPKPPENANPATPWPQYQNILRTSTSHQEGGERRWSVCTTNFKEHHGNLVGLDVVEVEWAMDKAGRQKMTQKPGTEFKVEAELVLLSMGFIQPVHEGLLDDLRTEYDGRGNVSVDPNWETDVPGVFAAGDATSGAWLVVNAIAAGRAMARAVDIFLMGETSLPLPPPMPRR